MEEERLAILKMVEAGQIGSEEAAKLLATLGMENDEPAAAPEGAPAEQLPRSPEQHWARFWIYPLMAGGGVLLLGALVMGLVYATAAAQGWLVCGWLPMILGLLVMALALWSRSARWLHLRISEGGKRRIAFSLPVPLTLAAWAVRLAQPFVPQLQETAVDDLILALRDNTSGEQPVYLDVQDEEAGEHVELYFG